MMFAGSLRIWVPGAGIDTCRFGEAWAALRAENLLTYAGMDTEMVG